MKKIKLALLATMTAFLFLSCDLLTGLNKDTPAAETPTEENKSEEEKSEEEKSEEEKSEEEKSEEEIAKEWFSVETCDTGIKITLADDVVVGNDSGSGFVLDEIPVILSIKNEDVEADRREFIYPWGSKGQEYTVEFRGNFKKKSDSKVEWHSFKQKCVSGGNLDYTKYFDIEAYKQSLVIPQYTYPRTVDGETIPESLTAQVLSPTFLKDSSILKDSSFTFGLGFNLGGVNYAGPSEWWNWSYISETKNYGDVFTVFVYEAGDKSKVMLEKLKSYDYKFAASANVEFKLKDDPDTSYSLPSIWSPQMTAKPFEFTDGKWVMSSVETDVSSDGSVSEYQDIADLVISDSVTKVECTKATKIKDEKETDYTEKFNKYLNMYGKYYLTMVSQNLNLVTEDSNTYAGIVIEYEEGSDGSIEGLHISQVAVAKLEE
ncbi:MAG: hypothetical protein K5866_07980 [Treponema sp.]|nr:hypothetical protein [Treponema sp.]